MSSHLKVKADRAKAKRERNDFIFRPEKYKGESGPEKKVKKTLDKRRRI